MHSYAACNLLCIWFIVCWSGQLTFSLHSYFTSVILCVIFPLLLPFELWWTLYAVGATIFIPHSGTVGQSFKIIAIILICYFHIFLVDHCFLGVSPFSSICCHVAMSFGMVLLYCYVLWYGAVILLCLLLWCWYIAVSFGMVLFPCCVIWYGQLPMLSHCSVLYGAVTVLCCLVWWWEVQCSTMHFCYYFLSFFMPSAGITCFIMSVKRFSQSVCMPASRQRSHSSKCLSKQSCLRRLDGRNYPMSFMTICIITLHSFTIEWNTLRECFKDLSLLLCFHSHVILQ